MIVANSTNFVYNLVKNATINTKATTYSDGGSQSVRDRITDGDIETYYDSGTATCYVGFDFGADYQAEIASIRYFLKIGSESEDFLGSVIETSDDDSTYTSVMVQNEIMTDGWNFW